ncbi:MAG: hypothetical protein JOZ71_01525 [Ktedonobacteraceae bacterium]|nr:hypothetical protein [Ktedonobacteraceae bacterium]MBV9019373.1 hypothetical protein [Ktedonobacteraceae bacterium]
MQDVWHNEQVIHITITAHEMLALDLAILFFQRYGKPISSAYEQAVPLLQQYQHRLQAQLQPNQVLKQ